MTSAELKANSQLERLVRRVRHQMQRIGPSGAYEFFMYKNMWGEFCHWVQYNNHGPICDSTWHQSVMLLVSCTVDEAPRRHDPELTAAAEYELGEFDEAPDDRGEYVDRNMIERAVYARLIELAGSRNIRRFVPAGLKDHYF